MKDLFRMALLGWKAYNGDAKAGRALLKELNARRKKAKR